MSLLLSCALCLTLLPAAALAADGTTAKVTTADELTAAVTEKTVSTIKLGADINVTSTIGIRRTVNLDLNDHVLRMTGDGNVIEVGNGGELTLVDDAQTKTPKYFDRETMVCGRCGRMILKQNIPLLAASSPAVRVKLPPVTAPEVVWMCMAVLLS